MLQGTDQDGVRIQLDAWRGRVVLVSFYAMSCAVCPSELGLVREFQTANRARGFLALVVSLDEREEDARTYARLQRLIAPRQQVPVLWRASPLHSDSFGAMVRRPTHVLIDRQGRQLLRRDGSLLPADWDDIWLALA